MICGRLAHHGCARSEQFSPLSENTCPYMYIETLRLVLKLQVKIYGSVGFQIFVRECGGQDALLCVTLHAAENPTGIVAQET